MKVSHDLTQLMRAEYGRLVGALVAMAGDLSLAEDALQEACAQALEQWQAKGHPQNPAAWLLTTARRRLVDQLRKTKHQNADATQQALLDTHPIHHTDDYTDDDMPDHRLELIFTCCHPAINPEAQVALTLKVVCGLSIGQIARAYLTSEIAMSKRIVRAKFKIKHAGIGYHVPHGAALEQRLLSVLAVIYLIYNESYNAYEGQALTQQDLALEAIHLAEIVHRMLPCPSVAGLLALLLLHDSRRAARSSRTQAYIPLKSQKRSLWNQDNIIKGTKLVKSVLPKGQVERYQVQAAISALHSNAASWELTDWPQIVGLYDVLFDLEPSPICCLNRCVALFYSGVSEQAYKEVKELEVGLGNYQPYHAAKAEMEVGLGQLTAAKQSYDTAIKLSKNDAERQFLKHQLGRL
ncbi:MAG TPA: RNA polymerase subunit sigma-24 [Oceanospirillaceae bacterium]|nr:RNA polymerase subunit sigma-24 [Oceanospirillaceae bacterium]